MYHTPSSREPCAPKARTLLVWRICAKLLDDRPLEVCTLISLDDPYRPRLRQPSPNSIGMPCLQHPCSMCSAMSLPPHSQADTPMRGWRQSITTLQGVPPPPQCITTPGHRVLSCKTNCTGGYTDGRTCDHDKAYYVVGGKSHPIVGYLTKRIMLETLFFYR